MEDGRVVLLENGVNLHTKIITGNGKRIVYNKDQEPFDKVAFNYLTIPRGGQYFVQLSDGTKVWLNSETQLKYPVSFKKGETRQVELLYGEAYFEVSPSSKHNEAKFKVYNKAQEIIVLGTKFNVKSYKDETSIYTTLIEGKISIKTPKDQQMLVPKEQSILNVTTNEIKVSVVDIAAETSWVRGDFVFQGKTIKEIMRVLERWYDVDIFFQDKKIEEYKFNGELSKFQKLEDILILIKKTNYIKDYEISGKKIILK